MLVNHVTKALYQAALKYYNTKPGINFTETQVLTLALQVKQHITLREILFIVQ